jgi:hypothetical protein
VPFLELIRKRNKKRRLIIPFIMIFCFILVIPKYDTFAWFTAQSNANGKITNASTSDLLKIDIGDVQYLKNCKLQTSVQITNISTIDIPIKLNVLNNNKGSESKVLKPGQSLMSETKNPDSSCETTRITYHLFGFEGYIDEKIVIPISSDKMIKPVEKPEKEEKAQEAEPNEEQKEVEKEEEPKAPDQAEPPPQDPENHDEASTEPEPPEGNEDSKNHENKSPDTPAGQTEEPPANGNEEDVQNND